MRVPGFLQNHSIMMILGLVTGISIGGFPAATKEISMGALALLMTISLTNIRLSDTKARRLSRDAVLTLALNYGYLSGVILLIGSFFGEELWWGWVLMAAAPSAISVVPFTSILKGDTHKALFSTSVNYLSALVLMPVISLALIGSAVSVMSLVSSLLLLIVLPMAVSRALMRWEIRQEHRASVTNIAFFVLIFAVAGSNREAFLNDFSMVMAVSAA